MANSYQERINALESNESLISGELGSMKRELERERLDYETLEKRCRVLEEAEKQAAQLKEAWATEKTELQARLAGVESQAEITRQQILAERAQLEESNAHESTQLEERIANERDEHKQQLADLERKLEEVIKEKAQISFKYGQYADANRELNALIQSNQNTSDQIINEFR